MASTSNSPDGLNNEYPVQLRNLGSLLLGTFLGLIFYGISVHQTYIFCSLRHKEPTWFLKPLVSVILLLESFHSALCMHASYDFLVVNRYMQAIPESSRWSMDILNVFAAVIFCFTQSLFARSVYRIWPRYGRFVVIAAGILTAGQFGTAIAATVLLYMPRTAEITREIRLLSIVHSAAVMVASALLAGSLIHRLRLLRRQTDFRKTEHTLKVLIAYTWNTGLLIFITSLLSLVFASVWPESRVCIAVDIVATQLYAVSLLAELNHRREWLSPDASSGTHACSELPAPPRSGSQWQILYPNRRASRGMHTSVRSDTTQTALWPSMSSAGINIEITTTTEVVRDGDKAADLKGVL